MGRMSGPMSVEEAIRVRLSSLAGPVPFEVLAEHLERDAIFIVAPTVSLLECGVAVAMDDVDRVRAWIDAGELRKPTLDERSSWPKAGKRTWVAIVVQPFVLVQDPPD
jgi:hypothetical protein